MIKSGNFITCNFKFHISHCCLERNLMMLKYCLKTHFKQTWNRCNLKLFYSTLQTSRRTFTEICKLSFVDSHVNYPIPLVHDKNINMLVSRTLDEISLLDDLNRLITASRCNDQILNSIILCHNKDKYKGK